MASTHHKGDFGAALTGLVVGACVLFALIFGIVELTHQHYVHNEPAAAAKTE